MLDARAEPRAELRAEFFAVLLAVNDGVSVSVPSLGVCRWGACGNGDGRGGAVGAASVLDTRAEPRAELRAEFFAALLAVNEGASVSVPSLGVCRWRPRCSNRCWRAAASSALVGDCREVAHGAIAGACWAPLADCRAAVLACGVDGAAEQRTVSFESRDVTGCAAEVCCGLWGELCSLCVEL